MIKIRRNKYNKVLNHKNNKYNNQVKINNQNSNRVRVNNL